jgi:hypothetical protein
MTFNWPETSVSSFEAHETRTHYLHVPYPLSCRSGESGSIGRVTISEPSVPFTVLKMRINNAGKELTLLKRRCFIYWTWWWSQVDHKETAHIHHIRSTSPSPSLPGTFCSVILRPLLSWYCSLRNRGYSDGVGSDLI